MIERLMGMIGFGWCRIHGRYTRLERGLCKPCVRKVIKWARQL